MSLLGINTSAWRFGRAHLSGLASEPDEVTIAYIDVPPAVSESDAKGTILLIHGFPQTSHQFRRVINPLAARGYRVVVPDYRGAGQSSRPLTGYDKATLARDLHTLLHEYLGVTGAVHVVGHDMGGMIAHAYAARFPTSTASVVWGECPLPGSGVYDGIEGTVAGWQFAFHAQLDLPEMLVAGKEKQYLSHFFTRAVFNHGAISEADKEHYAQAYATAGGLRCAFNLHRAFRQDAHDNTEWVAKKGKSEVPCLGLNGAEGPLSGEKARSQYEQFYENMEFGQVEGSGRGICAERARVR